MENSYLSHLDAMLADATWEMIRANQSDKYLVIDYIQKFEKLAKTNSRLEGKLRGAIQWTLENVEFNTDQTTKLTEQLDGLGGPIANQLPAVENTAQTEQVTSKFEIVPTTDIVSNEVSIGWRRVYGSELEEFLMKITPIDGKYRVSSLTTVVDWRPLPFYQNTALIRVHDPMWINNKMVIYYLTDEGNLFRLNGTSPPIHEVNNKAPIHINEENVLDYLRFFCFFVRGEQGPFYILESMDDPLIPDTDSHTSRSVIEGAVHPAKLNGLDENGNFLCQALVFYSNALFEGSFLVRPSGMIDMLNDEPIAGDLDCKIDAPIS